MKVLHTEGIVLKAIDFRDYDQIITVLTPERGIVKWIFKKRKPSPEKSIMKIEPLSRGEFTYTETKGEIWKCREISISNHYLKLRQNYAWLESAGRFINWILRSQVEHKPALKLYPLLATYLEKIPIIKNLPSLEISFLIQLLRNEGLITFDLHCSTCHINLSALHIADVGHFCAVHAPLGAVVFNDEETLAWMQIAACKTFSELTKVSVPSSLTLKTNPLFQILIQH